MDQNPSRNYSVDIIRVFAAFFVIIIHIKSIDTKTNFLTSLFTPFCVPFFFVASLTYFTLSTKRKLDYKSSINNIIRRIYVPYFSWTCIYLFLLVSKSIIYHQQKYFDFWKILFYGDSSVQLYFLPYLAALQIMALAIFLLIQRNCLQKKIGIMLLALSLSYFLLGDIFGKFTFSTILRYLGIFCYIPAGIFLATFINRLKGHISFLFLGIALILIALLIAYFNQLKESSIYSLFASAGGIGLMLIALTFPIDKIPSWLIKISDATFGIYLCHIIFLETFEIVLSKAFGIGSEFSFMGKLGFSSSIFLASLILTRIIKTRFFLARFLLGDFKNKI